MPSVSSWRTTLQRHRNSPTWLLQGMCILSQTGKICRSWRFICNYRVLSALSKETWADVSFETAEEISLLSSLLQMYDSCWEIKLRSLMKIFTHAIQRLKDPSVCESGVLPCLKIIQHFIRTTQNKVKPPAISPKPALLSMSHSFDRTNQLSIRWRVSVWIYKLGWTVMNIIPLRTGKSVSQKSRRRLLRSQAALPLYKHNSLRHQPILSRNVNATTQGRKRKT